MLSLVVVEFEVLTAATVHAFVTRRIYYGNSLFAHVPKIWTDKLQRVMNSAARVISDTRKFDRGLKRFLHEDLHWLDVPQRVTYKLCLLVLVSSRLGTTVSSRALCTGRRRHAAPQASLCHSRTTGFSSVQHELDGSIVCNAHNTVLGSKSLAICATV